MSLFAIADLHLSLGGDKPMDIFHGWENYMERIDTNWRRVVNKDDTVVIAGDVSWAMSLSQLGPDFDFIESLPGRKLIIKGNHDFWWETMAKMGRFLKTGGYKTIGFIHNSAETVCGVRVCGTRGWYYEDGEDKKILLREAGRLDASLSYGEDCGLEPVVFLHYPPVCRGIECDEIVEVMKKHGVRRCYYGHLHGRAAGSATEGTFNGMTYRLISSDHLRFMPAVVEA